MTLAMVLMQDTPGCFPEEHRRFCHPGESQGWAGAQEAQGPHGCQSRPPPSHTQPTLPGSGEATRGLGRGASGGGQLSHRPRIQGGGGCPGLTQPQTETGARRGERREARGETQARNVGWTHRRRGPGATDALNSVWRATEAVLSPRPLQVCSDSYRVQQTGRRPPGGRPGQEDHSPSRPSAP